MNAPLSADQILRKRLGIPPSAERVLFFVESSHWDTNWLQTSEGYFKSRLEPIFAAVLRELERDEQRVYCIESVFFLKLYWERHPEDREKLRQLFTQRRLRLLASSFTTPDTLLPHCETVLRDFTLGQRWLEEQGLPCAPSTAYFPDNFGHSPHTPSLMKEVGVNAVGVTRIDGMYFIAADYRSKSEFPLQGSTAHALQKQHRSLDFVWRDESGAEVLCHWNAFTYFQGDMLAHKGVVRWAGNVFGLSWRSMRHVAARIDGYVKQLAPVSKTPYLLCPIGMDFNDPIADLGPLLRQYNRERYGETGTWLCLAGLDDYFALLELQRSKLPVLSVDPNPYWMGFYATRPEVKQRPTRIARSLLAAEAKAALAPRDEAVEQALSAGWSTLVLSNHHDYITGTSPDAVWEAEQKPWLDAAESFARQATPSPSEGEGARRAGGASHLGRRARKITHHREGHLHHIETPHYQLTLDETRGGCLTSLRNHHHQLLDGLGFDLVAYHDEGGLWRLGHEYKGGGFIEHDRASRQPAKIDVDHRRDRLTLTIGSHLGFTRVLELDANEPQLRLDIAGRARRRHTVTARFETALDASHLEMDTVGGAITRERERIHSPTFWPVPSRLSIPDRARNRVLHALFDAPSAAAFTSEGHLEWIVARNAPKERAFKVLPVLAHPIGGTNDGQQHHRAALLATTGCERGETLARRSRERLRRHTPFDQLIHCDTAGVEVVAFKRAEAGEGFIVRLAAEKVLPRSVKLSLPGAKVRVAFRCDAHERDLQPLDTTADGSAIIGMTGFLATVRLIR
ncbi:MAG: hypothetical protein QM723_27265 [Myxococcaceae bacterium]